VAGAVVVALARRRTGGRLECRLAALALNHAVTNSRMGGTGNRGRARKSPPMAQKPKATARARP